MLPPTALEGLVGSKPRVSLRGWEIEVTAARDQLQGRECARWLWFRARAWLLALYSWLWFVATVWLGELQAYLRFAAGAWLGALMAWLGELNIRERARWTRGSAGWTIRTVLAVITATNRLHVRRWTRRAWHQVGHAVPWLIAIALVVGFSFLVTRSLG
jgi:hypothetical protein